MNEDSTQWARYQHAGVVPDGLRCTTLPSFDVPVPRHHFLPPLLISLKFPLMRLLGVAPGGSTKIAMRPALNKDPMGYKNTY